MKIGIVLYPTYGGSGVVATELGKALAVKGHEIHFITYSKPVRLNELRGNIYFHQVSISDIHCLSIHLTNRCLQVNW